VASKKPNPKGAKRALGAVKEQLKGVLSLVEESGEKCELEGSCLGKSDVTDLRKDLSKISTLVRRFAVELEITENRHIIEDYDAIDEILKKNSELLKVAESGMNSKVEKISEYEFEDEEDEEDEDTEDVEGDAFEDENVEASNLGRHRIKKEKMKK